MNKKQKRTKQQLIKVIIVIAIIAVCAIIAVLSIISTPNTEKTTKEEDETQVKWSTDKELEEKELEKLKSMTEKQRMQKYLSKYISFVENKKYEKAYNLLHDAFKHNYFPDIIGFENYVDHLYPETFVINYDDVQRQGKYFIISVTIINTYKDIGKINTRIDDDYIDDEEDYYEGEMENIQQKFVIYEKDYNDFELSFSV